MKKLVILLACMVFAAMVIGCGSSSPGSSASGNTANAGKVLKVGTDANFPPYEYYQAQSKTHTGFDIDLIVALAQYMGYDKVEFVNVEFSKIFDELNAKQYDLAIAGITVNPERAAKVAFTDTYIKDGFKIIVAKDNNLGDTIEALKGKRVVVENGSTPMAIVKEAGTAEEIIPMRSNEYALKYVIDGRADCLVISKMAGAFFIANGYGNKVKFAGDHILREDPLAIAVSKDNEKLVKELNEALKQYRNSQAYDQLYKTYFGNFH